MEYQKYHHGNLQTALIEAGIDLVHDQGIRSLSIRKVAAICGVSHAAPYNHFKNKDELLIAMQNYITEQFATKLEKVVALNKTSGDVLHELGKAYLDFFLSNPTYYDFIFNQIGITINLDLLETSNYPPFDIFKNAAISILKLQCIEEKKYLQNITAMWSIVHGITSMTSMDNVYFSGNWTMLLDRIMRDNFIFSK